MRVLGLCSYPIEAAATRYRLAQFVGPLAAEGIELEISSFLSREQYLQLYKKSSIVKKAAGLAGPFLRRLAETFRAGRYDAVFVQREAMFLGPAVFEWIYRTAARIPMVLDLDDATYISYESPTYGKLGSFFKFFGKTDKLIERAETVICGNRFIAEYVEKKGTPAVIVPTIVDTDVFVPLEKNNELPVLGWIGTHSTFPLLRSVFPVLEKLAESYRFRLKIVGAGVDDFEVKGVEVENLGWELGRETADFQSLDIGLYPITPAGAASSEWLLGKSGFKAIQYMSVGAPFVVTPVGVCAELGIEGETHLAASTENEWYDALKRLLESQDLRLRLGRAGRQFALEHFTISLQTKKIASVLKSAKK